MILVTTAPMAAGTMVTCPRCRTCFGVPALETKAAVAEVLSPAAPVPRAAPVVTAQPAPAAPPVAHAKTPQAPHRHPARPRPVAAPAAQPPGGEESWLTGGDAGDRLPRGDAKGADHAGKKGRRKKQDPAVLYLMIGAGVLLLVAGIIVAVVLMGDDTKPLKSAPREPGHAREAPPAKATDSKVVPAAANTNEKKPAAARSVERKKSTAAASGKKEKPDAMKGKEPDGPIPIPGLDAPAPKDAPPGDAESKDK
jgi:hypothetical protein